MKVMWISNIVFPRVCEQIGMPVPVSGGWLYSRAEQLSQLPDFTLAIASVYKGEKYHTMDIDGIRHYLIPLAKLDRYNVKLENDWQRICTDFQPDIVHINGTEYPHGVACMRACPDLRYAVSIQGLASVIARYYLAGMSLKDVWANVTLLGILSGKTILSEQKNMSLRGKYEAEYVSKADAISGRTSWDLAHCRSLKPSVPYFHSSRSLRSSFVNSPKWDIASKKEFSIFLSKGTSPFKGFHQVLKAVALLVSKYPQITIRVAGKDMLKRSGWKSQMTINNYQKYIRKLVDKLKLSDHVFFTGRLSEQQMADELLRAHVFICPSSIENSSNSIAEAQYLGVPVIASDVGGNMDLVEHCKSGFIYRFEEYELLAHYLAKIFDDNELAVDMSEAGLAIAKSRHDPQVNLQADIDMYRFLHKTPAISQ